MILALRPIVSMSPPSYPSAWLHPCRARFRFTWQSYCNSVRFCGPSFFVFFMLLAGAGAEAEHKQWLAFLRRCTLLDDHIHDVEPKEKRHATVYR